jgi:hypothetical protein
MPTVVRGDEGAAVFLAERLAAAGRRSWLASEQRDQLVDEGRVSSDGDKLAELPGIARAGECRPAQARMGAVSSSGRVVGRPVALLRSQPCTNTSQVGKLIHAEPGMAPATLLERLCATATDPHAIR